MIYIVKNGKVNIDMEELLICPICNNETDELIDTEGMVHGGIGYSCEQCLEDLDIHSVILD